MNGCCPMPVVINSGSGNQGITVSVPVIVYAQEKTSEKEKLLQGLVVFKFDCSSSEKIYLKSVCILRR